MRSDFEGSLNAMIEASGGRIWLVSGDRDSATQQRLWDQAVRDYGPDEARNWVAPPGHSNHEKGIAADLGGDLAWAAANAGNFGLHQPMSWEPWHYEPVGSREEGGDALAYTPARSTPLSGGVTEQEMSRQLTRSDEEGDPMSMMMSVLGLPREALLSGVGRGVLGSDAGGLAGYSRGITNTPSQSGLGAGMTADTASLPAGGGGGGEGGFDDWLNEIARIKGLDEAEKEALRTIAQYESNFRNTGQEITDINTTQGTPAFGPWQVIEPTFRSNAEAGYEDWRNPVHNGLAAYNYAVANYGSVQAVADRFKRTGRGGY